MMVNPGSDLNGVQAVAERIRVAVCCEPIRAAGGLVQATISLGVAANVGIQDADPLIGAADAALYRAKESGRNRVELALSAVWP